MKHKWSQDPQNSLWSRDKSKFGYRMLQRMGWEEGKGLGMNEDGGTEHIRINKKTDNKGVGSKRGRDDGWIEHQDAFDKILAGLNAAQGEKKTLPASKGPAELDVPSPSRTLMDCATESKKIVYKRFLRSKDLTAQSSEDLDCVLGRKRRKHSNEEIEGEMERNVPLISHGVTTVTKKQSVQDYFSVKMKAKKASDKKSNSGSQVKRKHKSQHSG